MLRNVVGAGTKEKVISKSLLGRLNHPPKNPAKKRYMHNEMTINNHTLEDFIMRYRRKKVTVYVRKSKYQCEKKNTKRGEYSWDVVWVDENGKRRQKTVNGPKSEADSVALNISLKLKKLLGLTPEELERQMREKTSLATAFELFIDARLLEGVASDTIKIFKRSWMYFLTANQQESIFMNIKDPGTVQCLAPKHARNLIAYLRSKSFGRKGIDSLSPFTQAKYYRHLKSILRWIHQNDFVEKDPSRGIREPSTPNKIVKALSPDQLKFALERTKDYPRGSEIYALLLAYLYLCCRATEILPPLFTWDHFHGGFINRPNLKQKKSEVEYFNVSLVGNDGEALRAILESRLKQKNKWVLRDRWGRPKKDKKGNQFSAPFPYSYWEVRRMISYKFFPDIGLKGTNLQMLRDTGATLRQLSGQPLSAVSALLGHSNASITMKYYVDKEQLVGSVAASLNITSGGNPPGKETRSNQTSD